MGAKVKGIFWMTKMFDGVFFQALFPHVGISYIGFYILKISLISIQLDVFIRNIFFTNIGVH